MVEEKQLVLKRAYIKNNCPECFHNELELTFYQKQKFGRFFNRTTGEVTNEIKCKKCHSTIYPVKWTDDIERSFNYFQKLAEPNRTKLTFTSSFFILLLIFIAMVATVVYLLVEKIIEF